jgi:hypothetical protein
MSLFVFVVDVGVSLALAAATRASADWKHKDIWFCPIYFAAIYCILYFFEVATGVHHETTALSSREGFSTVLSHDLMLMFTLEVASLLVYFRCEPETRQEDFDMCKAGLCDSNVQVWLRSACYALIIGIVLGVFSFLLYATAAMCAMLLVASVCAFVKNKLVRSQSEPEGFDHKVELAKKNVAKRANKKMVL